MQRTVWFYPAALLLVVSLAACDRGTPEPKTGSVIAEGGRKIEQAAEKTERVVNDAAITAKIKLALIDARDIKSGDIGVDTSRGRVILTGTVPEGPQAQRAASVAAGVEGVRDVENRLTVKTAS